ncbi:nucleoside/nucleotide kinase family protein [Arthrobacter sp. H5]|uniref:nucleoside/nucleotide kinase family protein n=1 Tax=Arthrobacter sp. H5 TaxID=1267973 RepID=UPI000482556F|nr:nucleoside/nucleotide kinase family protein [Arthrobacter sp. H5]
MSSADSITLSCLLERIAALQDAQPGTVIIGIVGTPGAGKTTLVEQLMGRLNGTETNPERQQHAHVPLDGFHLSDQELSRIGLLDRKGAPETFDVYGYAATLQRLKTPRESVVYAPGFERAIEQPIAGVVPVFPSAGTILTEGNYLLLDKPGWRKVREQCTEVWYCVQDDRVRLERLIQRHVMFGKSPTAAREWVQRVDEENARIIRSTRHRADLVVELEHLGAA